MSRKIKPEYFPIHEIWEAEDGRVFMVSFIDTRTSSSIEPSNLVYGKAKRLSRFVQPAEKS